ncbi:hypothetical protein TruAng_011850 [Truncatella angustata]|nr:hypothetical protein TruAng_011850 [Truncatella angustata]
MREVAKNKHQAFWISAIEAKYEPEKEGNPVLDREEFDSILGDFEGIADYPAAIFPAELIRAYPEAAVILTVRADEDAWRASMLATLVHHFRSAPDPNPSPMAPLAAKYHRHCWNDDFEAYGREAYRRQNALVRGAAAGRRFLEYETGSGWGPLCEFLGVPVPDGAYPRADDWLEYKKAAQEKEKSGGGA